MVTTSKHTILSAPHRSPLNGKKFVEAVKQDHPFTRINEILSTGGLPRPRPTTVAKKKK